MKDRTILLLAIAIGAITLGTAMLGCSNANAKANEMPWTSFIGEKYHLVRCDEAEALIVKVGTRRMELIHLYQSGYGTDEFRHSLEPKIDMLTQAIGEIHYWMVDTCTEA